MARAQLIYVFHMVIFQFANCESLPEATPPMAVSIGKWSLSPLELELAWLFKQIHLEDHGVPISVIGYPSSFTRHSRGDPRHFTHCCLQISCWLLAVHPVVIMQLVNIPKKFPDSSFRKSHPLWLMVFTAMTPKNMVAVSWMGIWKNISIYI